MIQQSITRNRRISSVKNLNNLYMKTWKVSQTTTGEDIKKQKAVHIHGLGDNIVNKKILPNAIQR